MEEIYNDSVQEDVVEDVTKTADDYTDTGLKATKTNSRKEKPVKHNKVETHQMLSVSIKNDLLTLIKDNMPQLKRSMQAMLDEGDFKGYAATMASLMKYGAPTLQSVNVDMEESAQDSITKKLANLIKGGSITEDIEE